jgi:hypothetical protein
MNVEIEKILASYYEIIFEEILRAWWTDPAHWLIFSDMVRHASNANVYQIRQIS